MANQHQRRTRNDRVTNISRTKPLFVYGGKTTGHIELVKHDHFNPGHGVSQLMGTRTLLGTPNCSHRTGQGVSIKYHTDNLPHLPD